MGLPDTGGAHGSQQDPERLEDVQEPAAVHCSLSLSKARVWTLEIIIGNQLSTHENHPLLTTLQNGQERKDSQKTNESETQDLAMATE